MGLGALVKVVYGVCVGSWDKLLANVIPRIGDRPLIAVSGQTSIAVAYNAILDAAMEMKAEALILQHDDLEITDPEGEAKLLATLQIPNTGIVGVAGGLYQDGIAWWNHSPIGHQRTDVRDIDFGIRSGSTQLLEGSLLVLSKWAIYNLGFDTNFPGFHGYDVDISLQALRYGKGVKVADVDTHHHTQMGFKSAQSHQDWLTVDQKFRTKWGQQWLS
jgi:hypothetical protein